MRDGGVKEKVSLKIFLINSPIYNTILLLHTHTLGRGEMKMY